MAIALRGTLDVRSRFLGTPLGFCKLTRHFAHQYKRQRYCYRKCHKHRQGPEVKNGTLHRTRRYRLRQVGFEVAARIEMWIAPEPLVHTGKPLPQARQSLIAAKWLKWRYRDT